MFEIGDNVNVNSFGHPRQGVIVDWHFDEGNVWIVEINGAKFECSDSELSPATDAYGHPWTYRPAHSGG
jgi:hypothetical protein